MIPPFWHWRSAEICLGLFWSIGHGIGSLSLTLSICISGNLFAFVFNLKTENSNLESGIFLLCCSLTLSAESGEVSWLIALIYNDNGSDRTWDLWASSQQRYIHRKNENRKTDGESAGQGHGCWNPLNIAWAQLLPACQPAYLDDDDASSPLMNESFQFENFQTNLSKTHKKERQRGRAEEMERLCKLMKFQVCCLSLLFFAWLCVHFHCIFLVNCSWLNYKCMQPSQRPSFKPIQLPI